MNYPRPVRWIHWSLAILVTLQLAIAVVLTQLRSLAYGQFVLALHRQLGLVILLLVVARLFLKQETPALAPGTLPMWQLRAAGIVHRLFIVFLLLQPLMGILVAWARGDAVGLLGLMQIHSPFDISDAARERLTTAHEVTAALLFALCLVHIGAVFFNRVVRQVSVMNRMLPTAPKDLLVNRVPVVTQLSLAFGLVILIAAAMGTNAVITYRQQSRAAQAFQEGVAGVTDQLRNAQITWKELKAQLALQPHDSDVDHAHELLDAARSSLDEASAHLIFSDLKPGMAALTMKLATLGSAHGLPSAEALQGVDADLQALVDSMTMSSLQARSDQDENAARGHDLIVVTMLPMLMVGLIAALVLSRSITSLLSHMQDLIRSIEEDRRDSIIRVEGNGEFAALIRDISSMRDAVGSRANTAAARQAELEAERTRAAQDVLRKDAEMERQHSVSRRIHREQLAADFELQVADIVGTLVQMAKELSVNAARMATSAASSTRSSLNASEGAMRTYDTASEVAAKSGELSTTARSVRGNAEESKSRAGLAVQEATSVKRQIERLLAAIEQISATTDSIAAVARQTRLLAINARIEAARAGDVGRGFSVVAEEVKVLANQTREATRAIESHIAQVKAAAAVSADSLLRLDQVIAGVDQATSAIFVATDAQFASTKQLVERMADINSATRLVVDGTNDAREKAGETELISNAVLDAVAVIDEQADELRAKIATFVLELRDGGNREATTPPPKTAALARRPIASQSKIVGA
jgi:methyl-accepting chemotaxis protein/cytochrome b561